MDASAYLANPGTNRGCIGGTEMRACWQIVLAFLFGALLGAWTAWMVFGVMFGG